MKKTVIRVECMICDVSVDLDKSEYTVTSTDQGAVFVRRPEYWCDNCKSGCVVSEVEIEDVKQETVVGRS